MVKDSYCNGCNSGECELEIIFRGVRLRGAQNWGTKQQLDAFIYNYKTLAKTFDVGRSFHVLSPAQNTVSKLTSLNCVGLVQYF